MPETKTKPKKSAARVSKKGSKPGATGPCSTCAGIRTAPWFSGHWATTTGRCRRAVPSSWSIPSFWPRRSPVTGSMIGESACHILNMKRELRKHKAEVEAAQALLVMSCGAGIQTFSEVLDKPVYTANDSLFLGNIQRFGHFSEHCSLCGSCIVNETGGICPVTNCPKGLLNGPCGGVNKGKCELDSERDCAWVKIYNRLKALGQLDKLRKLQSPKDYCPAEKPRSRVIERKESLTQGGGK